MYNWQYKEWPHFSYSIEDILPIAVAFAKEMGELNGLLTGLNAELKQEAFMEILIAEAMKTSEIEGEYISREDVMSSIKRNLGIKDDVVVHDQRVTGVAKLMTTVRESAVKELSVDLIQQWHAILMAGFPKINAGVWRTGDEPMQIISGSYGKEVVHYEAPPSVVVPKEMEQLVHWFNPMKLKSRSILSVPLSRQLLSICILNLFILLKMGMDGSEERWQNTLYLIRYRRLSCCRYQRRLKKISRLIMKI